MSKDPYTAETRFRLEEITETILAFAGGDLSARGTLSGRGDEFDAVVGGLNMMAEEFQIMFDTERRRTVELKAAQAQLVQAAKLASLGEIAAGIAHELNQPLGIIQLYCESAIEAVERGDLSELDRYLIVAVEQVQRASGIIEHVRLFSRDDAHRDRADVNVEELVAGGLLLLRRGLAESDIVLAVVIDPELTVINCHGHRLQQVLFNLVANARDAVEGRPDAKVEVHARRNGRGVAFDVRDNGPGVGADYVERIMDPFFTTKPSGRGTGLGLPICQTIAREHGGLVRYDRGNGWSTFTLELPESNVS